MPPSIEEAKAAVEAKGDEIRELKKSGGGKEAVMALVAELNALKAAYEDVAGEPYPAPQNARAKKPKKGKKGAQAPAPAAAAAPAPAAAPAGASAEPEQVPLHDELAAHLRFALAYGGARDPDAPPAPKKNNKRDAKKAEKAAKKAAAAARKAAVKAQAAAGEKANAQKKKEKAAKLAEFEFENTTPEGQKKDTTVEMPSGYQPRFVEAAWQEWWEASGFYAPDEEKAATASHDEKFVIVIPPPNVTGSLHLGHALTCAVEDCMVRWHRMLGHVTLWVPGTDHAGIATQTVVEKKLQKDEGLSRHDLGREAFVERVWEWKSEYGSRITRQLRKLGASVDWGREAFTMDDNLARAVLEAFCRMHAEGLIYRATRLVNWSCSLRSAISDIEVDRVELTGRTLMKAPGHDPAKQYEFGVITSFAYKVKGSATDEEIVVATTRLETMLGDVAVAVHPEDPRYTHLHGAELVHPFVPDRRIVVVTDDILVDMSFGTGAVKITPAHDPNDFACGRRHQLPEINILTDTGAINDNGGEFEGLMRYDAREAIEARLTEMGLYRGKEDNPMSLGVCSRSKDIIEPMLKPQWWVSCGTMAAAAADAVRNGELQLMPSFHEGTWFHWLDNIQDWCISRQLWWGHRIPAYLVYIDGEVAGKALGRASETGDHRNDNDNWVVGHTEAQALEAAAAKFGVDAGRITLEQDPDVLDTWFSSGIFPFSVFQWPEDTADLRNFYPTHLLETGHDILFFWVARMVMMGLHLTGRLPFTKVYMHAMVRDKYGRKMSKSLGNVIDPLEVINGCTLDALLTKIDAGNLPPAEIATAKKGQRKDFPDGIPECGTDALRLGLLAYTIQGRDVNLDIDRIVSYRHFCNKLWNAMRFALGNFPAGFAPCALADLPSNAHLQTRDRWILSRLAQCVESVDTAFRNYAFGDIVTALYNFMLTDLCDAYLEFTKPVMRLEEGYTEEQRDAALQTLFHALDATLRLFHPLMPFVTEELWQRLPGDKPCETVMLAPYPQPADWVGVWRDEALEADMGFARECIHALRGLRATYNLAPRLRPDIWLWSDDAAIDAKLAAYTPDIVTLGKPGNVERLVNADPPAGCGVAVVNAHCQVFVMLRGLVDPAKEIAKLQKGIAKAQKSLAQIDGRRARADYETKIPDKIKAKDVEDYERLTQEVANSEATIERFESFA